MMVHSCDQTVNGGVQLAMEVPPKNAGWFLEAGKSHRSKWMMTGGTPISGNHQINIAIRNRGPVIDVFSTKCGDFP